MITLDTSSILALLNRSDPDHAAIHSGLAADPGPYMVPVAILAEVGYMVSVRLGMDPLQGFLADLEAGAYTVDCGEGDWPRIRELLDRYRNLGLGFADAAVVACAERHSGRVLTLDRRDFDVMAGEGAITVLPADRAA